jgi:hypothetical protein
MIDFNEIIDGDTFELFCRDFFIISGFSILEAPSKGQDGGVDLIGLEYQKVHGNRKPFKWLISCKHYSKSQKHIGMSLEQDLRDRVEGHHCDGFLGFYSTMPTSNLIGKLKKCLFPYSIYDNKLIEFLITNNLEYEKLFIRYFPLSYKRWFDLYYYKDPLDLFDFYFKNRRSCGRDVLLKFLESTERIFKFVKYHDVFVDIFNNSNTKVIIICDSIADDYIYNIPILTGKRNYLRLAAKLNLQYNLHLHKNGDKTPLDFERNFESLGIIIRYGNLIILNERYNNIINDEIKALKEYLFK